MAHVVVLGLVLTLVIGVVSFAVLVRKVHARPSRLPQSIPTPLLLYNVWIAAWLVAQYMGLHVYPSLPRPVVVRIALATNCALVVLALAWLRAHVVLVDQFLGSRISALARRAVGWLAWALGVLAVVALALTLASPPFGALARAVTTGANRLLFPVALAASILLAVGARQKPDDRIRRALSALAYSYVVLFALLALLVIVFWSYALADPAVLLSADLVLELGYNVLTVVWVGRHADAFAAPGLSEAELARGFDALCESCAITKREREVIELVCQGLTNQQIADRLFISLGTVKDHNYTIFQKTGVRNRTQLAKLFMRPPAEARVAAQHPPGIRRVV